MKNQRIPLGKTLKFLQEAEKLKSVLRHSWLSSGRQESVAEHTWRIALWAIVIAPQTDIKIDLLKVIKMAIVHDLGEIYAGDKIAWKRKSKNKSQQEKKALLKLTAQLPATQKSEITNLWQEYEEAKTPEAKFTKAIDKLETIDQHNLADISTWASEEYGYNLVHGTQEVKFSKILSDLKILIDQQTRAKIANK